MEMITVNQLWAGVIVIALFFFITLKRVFFPGKTAPPLGNATTPKKSASKSRLSKLGGWMWKWFVRSLYLGPALAIALGVFALFYVIANDGLGNTKAPVVQPQTLELNQDVWLGPFNTGNFQLVTKSGTTLLNVEYMDGSKQPYEIRHRPEDVDKNLDIGNNVKRFWLSSKYGKCEVDLTQW